MSIYSNLSRTLITALIALIPLIGIGQSDAAENRTLLVRDAEAALETLYKSHPGARSLSTNAAGILVFPKIVRAGFVVGGSTGNGVLFKNGNVIGRYTSGSASVGMQAGVQSFGYAVFFMTEKDLKGFRNSNGWDIGTAPTVVVIDSGTANELNTMTTKKATFAFVFNQEGLMAGMALQGQKITRSK